ncbi:MAG: sigma 54-interacting transcriptional regulator [Thermoanaerobaculia bacterium]
MTDSAPLEAIAESAPSLRPVLQTAARAAAMDVPVLILGEAGTGRSTVARALHAASSRAGGPLVEVDVEVIPSALFESEMFGYLPGAFTGAQAATAGRVARAEGGTLLLDHLEGIPFAAQPKLLRLLAEKQFSPLGGEDVKADVRFVGIGSEDLPERVRRGAFRQDLFYRLEVVTLRLEPLRHRKEDLDPLFDFFLADLKERFGHDRVELSARARAWMADYSWPGNLREIRNTLERSLILEPSGHLDPPPPAVDPGGRPASLAEMEENQILRVLAYSRGHQGRAAEILGISRKTLWEKRRRYGIP